MSYAPLSDMALFVEVVKARSFRRAAATLGTPNSTVSRRISALEKAIGLRLLHRTTRKIELTEAGQIYYDRCRRIVDEARLAHEQLGEMLEQPSGLLRVSLPVDFATIYLAPRMAEFASRYPGIAFEFDLTPRRVDLVTEPFDLAVRMGEQPDSTLIARKLAVLPHHLYASPAYLASFGEPAQPDDLAKHECVLFRGASHSWKLFRGNEAVDAPVAGRFRVNSIGMMHQFAVLKMGIAALAEKIVAEDLANNRLCRVLPEWETTPIPVYAVTETRLLPAKTQRFLEFLQECLRQIRDN